MFKSKERTSLERSPLVPNQLEATKRSATDRLLSLKMILDMSQKPKTESEKKLEEFNGKLNANEAERLKQFKILLDTSLATSKKNLERVIKGGQGRSDKKTETVVGAYNAYIDRFAFTYNANQFYIIYGDGENEQPSDYYWAMSYLLDTKIEALRDTIPGYKVRNKNGSGFRVNKEDRAQYRFVVELEAVK